MNTVWILLMVASIIFSFLNGWLDAFTKSILEGAKSAVAVCVLADLVGIIIAIRIVKFFFHLG